MVPVIIDTLLSIHSYNASYVSLEIDPVTNVYYHYDRGFEHVTAQLLQVLRVYTMVLVCYYDTHIFFSLSKICLFTAVTWLNYCS